jgi:predicted GIY-YIG superfamily endonuclease
MLRDKLLARLREMGDTPDHRRLVSEVLGIHGAGEALARRLVAQALVLEDRRENWRRAGERVCREAPAAPAVYVLRDHEGTALYVGKAVNLRRRLHAHFAARRWKATRPPLARAVDADWELVGSEIEALLKEADLIERLRPPANVQVGPPQMAARTIPAALVRDVIVLARSIEHDSVELVAARTDGRWMMQRTRRSGADLAVHATRLRRFFSRNGVVRRGGPTTRLAPIIYSWLAGRGSSATRLDAADVRSTRDLRARLAALLADERLFADRLVIYS